ncbi:MAG: LytTR family transcriptional regulator [Clostridia bacterium]|nr:LytTR family transcriptional regulator [Clostridia bacterium]
MDIEIKVDEKYNESKIIIYTNKMDEEITNIIDSISSINQKTLKAVKDDKMYILNQKDIETVYSENGKVYVRSNHELYTIKNRLYELESILDKKCFTRISNSEIVNFNLVENIDFKILGTIVINFISGNKSYASRRYIPKIKEFLEI